jgi:hypothetical protein
MADIFDELLGSGAPAPELIAALRRQKTLGTVGALSGDKSIARMGGAQMEDSVRQATDLRDRRDRTNARSEEMAYRNAQAQALEGDRKADREYRDRALKQARELAEAQLRNQREIAGLRQSASGGSPFQKERERKLAGESVEWDTNGKIQAAGARTDISNAISALENDKTIGSSWLSALPGDEYIRAKLDPKGLEVQRLANRVTVENLRQTYGPQFTEKEGTQFKALDYDPGLSNAQNLANLKKKLALIDAHTRRKNELFGQYRQDDMPNYDAPETLVDQDLVNGFIPE